MTDYAEIVQQLRTCDDSNYDAAVRKAATAISTLLAQRAVLVEEVEAWRKRDDSTHLDGCTDWAGCVDGCPCGDTEVIDAARAATDAAFPEGLTK